MRAVRDGRRPFGQIIRAAFLSVLPLAFSYESWRCTYVFGDFVEMPTRNTFQECKLPVRRWTDTSFSQVSERPLFDIPAL
jgi:hypothetical protein